MGRHAKIPLKDIILVPDVNPRDGALAATKATSAVRAQLRRDQLQAMVHGIKQWDGTEGEFLRTFGGLTVAEPPTDLPRPYKTQAKAGKVVLVDGYQRYEALRQTKGPDYLVTIKPVNAPTMKDLRALAFDCNFDLQGRYFAPLSQEDIWAHFMRTSLWQGYEGMTQKQIGQQLGGRVKASYIKDWVKVTGEVNDLISLNGCDDAQTKAKLREFLKNCLGVTHPSDFDSSGYPLKGKLLKALEVATNGIEATQALNDQRSEHRALRSEQAIEAAIARASYDDLETLQREGLDNPNKLRALADLLEARTSTAAYAFAPDTAEVAPEGFFDED